MSRTLARTALTLADWMARRSLALQSRVGGWLGQSMLLSGQMRRRLQANLDQAGYGDQVSVRQAAAGVGRMALETVALWRTPDAEVLNRVRWVDGWDDVLAARDKGQAVIFLTPHLATFEIASLFIGSQLPITVMFRPPKVAWAEPMMRAGRDRMQIVSVPAEMNGVRAMLKALRKGETIGLLPDQVPTGGDGAWAPFFGRQAYTMTLVQKLAKTTGALVVMVACVRLPTAAGYRLIFMPMAPFSASPEAAAHELNAAVEAAIACAPDQYLWTYKRFKQPANAGVPPTNEGSDT